MANWKYKLKIKQIWNDEDMPIEKKGEAIAAKIRQTFPASWFEFTHQDYDRDLDEIAQALDFITGYDEVEPVEEFDGWMAALYDWADQEVAPFEQWPPNKMCWVETF